MSRKKPRQGNRNKSYSQRKHQIYESESRQGWSTSREREIGTSGARKISEIDTPTITVDSALKPMEPKVEYPID